MDKQTDRQTKWFPVTPLEAVHMSVCAFETGTHYVVRAGLEYTILLLWTLVTGLHTCLKISHSKKKSV